MADVTIDSKRLVFPGLAGLYESLSPYAYDFMRFSAGAVLAPHGVLKVFFKSVGVYADVIGKAGLPRCLYRHKSLIDDLVAALR